MKTPYATILITQTLINKSFTVLKGGQILEPLCGYLYIHNITMIIPVRTRTSMIEVPSFPDCWFGKVVVVNNTVGNS